MTERAQKLKAPAKPAPESARLPRFRVVVNQAFAEPRGTAETDHIPADRLALAARSVPRDLPHRRALEALFGQPLTGMQVHDGPLAEAALEAEGADAATVGDAILLRRNAPLAVVAHEVTHLLQMRGLTPVDPAAAEIEAVQSEARLAAGMLLPAPLAGLDPFATAFRRPDDLTEADLAAQPTDAAAAAFQAATTQPAPGAETNAAAETGAATGAETGAKAQPAVPGTGQAPAAAADENAPAAPDLGTDLAENPVPTFEPAPMPEVEVDAEAAKAEAEAGLAASDDADGLMTAFKSAPPSVKAQHHDTLEADAGQIAADEQAGFDADLPVFEARMTGTDDLVAPAAVATPESRAPVLETDSPAPPPEPQVDPTPDHGEATANSGFDAILSRSFGASADANGLGAAFSQVNTSDPEVETGAGARPEVVLQGETDPARVAEQDQAARDEAAASREAATQAILDGPGPETVTLLEVQQDYAADPRAAPVIAPADGPVEGAAAFRDKALDPEVVALFDQHHGEAMAASMAAAETETQTAVQSRNTERDAEVAKAETESARLNADADTQQRTAVADRRQDVQTARQTAVDAQAGHVADLEASAQTAGQSARTEIDGQIATTDSAVATSFATAETDTQAEVTQGNTDAEAERNRQESEAANASWWDRATDWIADQFDKLTSFINDVFDAVRSAVKGIIDAVKTAAIALIDAAARAITGAIKAFGEVLKAGVNALLAEHFPQVAAALNAAIDGAVQVATDAVNAVADTLKAGISALLDALAAGLDAILALYQAAVNAALALAKAALTGDWAALAKLILEPVLRALGIEPQAFYDAIARALEALDIIIDDPIGFLANLLEAVRGGISRFADNLLTHLQAGIIAWLTGALGGDIRIPTEWNLMAVLDLARQILGLTGDMIRRVAVRVLGTAAVERIEFFMGYVTTLITGGWGALWDQISQDLTTLKDMVLDQIKSFLIERIIIASITWIASLFSPVGALLKLVMTIWNLIMFLKDQLSRIIDVALTIINGMYEIATGVLQPAMQRVEAVLGRLLPIAIDLLARLLGLGDIAGRVRGIIGDVRQRIEDALTGLIQRVLRAFRGGGTSAAGAGATTGAGATGAGADSDTDLMRPVPFGSGSESHTLYIQEQGTDAVPMMRSAPTPVEVWLQGLGGAGIAAIGATKSPAWSPEEIRAKKTEVAPLVVQALASETQLDSTADTANRNETTAAPAVNPGAAPAAAAPASQVAAKGAALAKALGEVLEILGLDAVPLDVKFADEIKAMGDYAAPFLRTVVRNLDAKAYGALNWSQVAQEMPKDDAVHDSWKKPAASGSIIRTITKDAFLTLIADLVDRNTVEDSLKLGNNPAALDNFMNHNLTAALNEKTIAAKLLAVILSPAGGNPSAIVAAVKEEILEAARKRSGESLEFDYKFTEVTGSYFRDDLVPHANTIMADGTFGLFFADDAENDLGKGKGENKPLLFFLNDQQSKRSSKNRSRLGDAVRAAQPGNHEWIAARLAANALSGAADAIVKNGDIKPLQGAAAILNFQHMVRTPTLDLIFDPTSKYPAAETMVTDFAKEHLLSPEHATIPTGKLPDDLKVKWYPADKAASDKVDRVRLGLLQGHPGAVYAQAYGGVYSESITQQILGHSEWDKALELRVLQNLGDSVTFRDMKDMGEGILDFFAGTIWQGNNDPTSANSKAYPLYFISRSEGDAISYAGLKARFGAEFGSVYLTLEGDIRRVIG